MSLAPEIKAFLEAGAGAPAVWEAPLSTIRANTQGRMVTSGVAEPVAEVINRFIPGPTADLPIRIYRPHLRENAPAILYFHGGGFVLNFLDIYDASLSRLANQSECVVISVQYQKAPEHPFPIPFDDCYSTFMWVRENAEKLKINPELIAIAGDSAGATLASAVAIKARDNHCEIPLQLLIYPCNGINFETDSYRDFAEGYGLTTRAMKWFWEQYLQGDSHNDNPYAVPMSAPTLAGVAPAIIVAAPFDPLFSDGVLYADKLSRDGVSVTYKSFDGMNHGFVTNMGVTPMAQTAIDWIATEVRKVMA